MFVSTLWNTVAYVTLFTLVVEISGQDESHVDKGALVGKPLVLSCTLPASQKVPPIRWVDFVYNTKDGEPMVIFDGTQVSADHPQASRYSVNKDDYSLTINNVTGDDAGQYICSTKIGGTGHQASYMVAVADNVECSGKTMLYEDESMSLVCSMKFWGSALPEVRWIAGTENAKNVEDRTQIGNAVFNVGGKASWEDNKLPYQCQMTYLDIVEQCELTMNVMYSVRNLQLNPVDSRTVPADGYVACSANGNPEPTVTLTAKNLAIKQTGVGLQRILVKKEWVGRNVTFECTARNSVSDKDTEVADSVTLAITEIVTTVLPTLAPSTATTAVAQTTSARTPSSPSTPSSPLSEHSRKPLHVSVKTTTESVKPDVEKEVRAASVGGGDNMTGIVIGVIIGALVIIVIIVAVVCMKKRKKEDQRTANKNSLKKNEDIRRVEDGRKCDTRASGEEKQPLTVSRETEKNDKNENRQPLLNTANGTDSNNHHSVNSETKA